MGKNKKDALLGYLFLLPSILLILLLIGYPMIRNLIISFQKVPLNPKKAGEFIGFDNYSSILTDWEFYKSFLLTVGFTALVVILSTALGLAVAIFFNRKFMFKRLVLALVLLPYIVPSISVIFAWKYMFNNVYGIINYILVDKLHVFKVAPLWFDDPKYSFVIVVLFSVWKFFPYAYLTFYAILQTVDKSYYESASLDGAGFWKKFTHITIPEIMPVLITVVTLRTIWVFYMFTEVYLLTKRVPILGVYLYDSAFAVNDFGKAAAISISLFAVIFAFIMLLRKSAFAKQA
ncbi:carbohydrate ABC transporter permease [Paenibacillus sp. OV219]|uniref:carbohydrate ABC transporter permease n=1 Tax=Paenibacillus sp. OV219 TaxID=1884377 RepID=UPI0008C5BF8C|nr:sugar ABC transporter permease [Paenibacillus sp. OV219]SEO12349.1 carbohydrate ABC transporter membrane protein 1, CUT1 family [Paenibacillus sp. OV219]